MRGSRSTTKRFLTMLLLPFIKKVRSPSYCCTASQNHEFELKRAFAKDGLRGAQTNSFYYRSIKHWNEHSREVVNSLFIAVFKNQIDIAWQNKRFI